MATDYEARGKAADQQVQDAINAHFPLHKVTVRDGVATVNATVLCNVLDFLSLPTTHGAAK